MSKAVKGYEELLRLKKQEIEQYYRDNETLLKPFVQMLNECRELQCKGLIRVLRHIAEKNTKLKIRKAQLVGQNFIGTK